MKRKYLLLVVLTLLIVAFASAGTPMLLRVVTSGQNMQNETVIYFDSSATVAHNTAYDALSLGMAPGYLNIVSQLNNMNYQVKGLPLLTQNISIPLRITTGTSGSYQIYANEISNLPQGACIWLFDQLTGTNWDLRVGAYTCQISDTEQASRFTLNIITYQINPGTLLTSQPTCAKSANGSVVVNMSGSGTYDYYWKDSQNTIIRTALNRSGADTLSSLNAGFYRVDINASGTCNHYVNYAVLQATHAPKASFTGDTLVHEMQDIFFTNTSAHAASYWWEFGDGMGSSDEHPLHAYGTPATYTVSLMAFGSVCNDTAISKRVVTVTGSTGANEIAGSVEPILIKRDPSGYYVEFNYSIPTDATIQLSDYLGRSQGTILKQNITNNRVYLDLGGFENKIILVNVQAGAHQTSSKLFVD